MLASNSGHLECVKELLNMDAQVNVQDEVMIAVFYVVGTVRVICIMLDGFGFLYC